MGKAAAIILAAGQGSRMQSRKAKVLHEVAGLEMVNHAVRSVKLASFDKVIVVVGYQGDKVAEVLDGVTLAWQKEQLGTGHAVDQCRELLKDFDGSVLVTYGDTPLFRSATFQELVEYHNQNGSKATILTAMFDDPTGYGRILRGDDGHVLGVVEHQDASLEQRQIKEINTGTYCFDSKLLFHYLTQITPANAQAEYYLPDVLPLMLKDGHRIGGFVLGDAAESMGINDRIQLSLAEAILRDRICAHWQRVGVTILDPKSTWIEWDCQIGQDTVIYPGTFIQKGTIIGQECRIGPNCRLEHAQIADGVTLENTIISGRVVAKGEKIAPFSVMTK
ncbi:MAG: NTP transferase domain-containing protein [Firmicutes bacterium]|nr:NTP transferase domain-containing protein [Bacillota bacterium]